MDCMQRDRKTIREDAFFLALLKRKGWRVSDVLKFGWLGV